MEITAALLLQEREKKNVAVKYLLGTESLTTLLHWLQKFPRRLPASCVSRECLIIIADKSFTAASAVDFN